MNGIINYQKSLNYAKIKCKAKKTELPKNAIESFALLYSKFNGSLTEKQASSLGIVLGLKKFEWIEILKAMEIKLVSEQEQAQKKNPFYIKEETECQ